MAGSSRETPWSNGEKKFLLAEIFKASDLTPSTLLNVITSNGIQPRWEDMPLPQTRSLNSCKAAYNELLRAQPQTAPPTPHGAPSSSLKRQFQSEAPYGVVGREIRPKPSGTSAVFGQPSGSASEQPTKRKRGRPTKAEQQARAAARGDMGSAPPLQLQTMPPTLVSAGSGSVGPVEETRSVTSPIHGMTVASALTPTQPKSESHSGSSGSSGKRRRGRSGAKLQSDTNIATSVGGAMPMRRPDYGSPSRRPTLPPLQDPRSVTRRHHDNIIGLPREQTPSGGQYQDQRPPPPRPAFPTMEPRSHIPLPPPPAHLQPPPPPPPPQD